LYNITISPSLPKQKLAVLAFLGCPLIAGIIAGSKTQTHKQKEFFAGSGLVFGMTLLLFIIT